MGFASRLLGPLRWVAGRLGGNEDEELERELPYAAMMITLMSASGITPYDGFKRLRKVESLPRFREEAETLVREVEVLGKDPLTAMEDRAEAARSRNYRDFLEGYISSVKSGGSVVSYLKSKLRSIFEVRIADATHAIERLETLVEAYMVMLIVVLCLYILSTVLSSPALSATAGVGIAAPSGLYPLLLMAIPSISLVFMYLAHNLRQGTLKGLRGPYLKALPPAVASTALLLSCLLVPQLHFIAEALGLPLLVCVCLVATSLPPALTYLSISRRERSAERALPSFLRDVTEARKTGLSPEKSIAHAARRRGYGPFSSILRKVTNQIEWGVSLRRIFEEVRSSIMSWPVRICFRVLVETIEIGGGAPETLELLAEYSEKMRDIEENQRGMLRPYLLLPFLWTVLMALTVTFTLYTVTQINLPGASSSLPGMAGQLTLLSAAIVFHCWLSGFFIGKVSEGAFAAGFKYAPLLAVAAYSSLLISQRLVQGFFGGLSLP